MRISKLIFSTLAALFISTAVQASPIPADADAVALDMKIQVDGKAIAVPYTLLLLGETGTITQKNDDGSSYVINVTPTKTATGFVEMAFRVSKDVAGQMTLLSSPRVITANNETASMEQQSRGAEHGHDVKLTVTPTL